MIALVQTAAKMSPRGNLAVLATLAGDQTTETLHRARREVAVFADRLVCRNRGVGVSAARKEMASTALAAYDELAAVLAERGAL